MRRLRDTTLYDCLRGVLYGLSCLPPAFAYWWGARLGDLAYLLLAKRRRVAAENLALAFGEEKTSAERQAIVRAMFRNLGKHVVDFSRLRYVSPDTYSNICTIEGLESARALVERRRGLLVISAHFGSWELVPAVGACFEVPIWVIVRPLDQPVLDRLVEEYRLRSGYQIIPRQQAMAQSLSVLRQGSVVGVLMDQNSLRREGVAVEFFGIKTYTSKGPALLALRAQCPVIGAFVVREAVGRHRLILTPEIPVRHTGNVQHDLEENTREFNRVLETYIRRYPDHWFWLHRRWKRRLPGSTPQSLSE